MKTQQNVETNQVLINSRPVLVQQDELYCLRRELTSLVFSAPPKNEQSLRAYIDRVAALKAEIIGKSVERRLSKVTPCRFQMMVDGVPYYQFSDLETGTQFQGIAYGTEANWLMYRLKADLEKAVRHAAGRELVWVDEAIASWSKALSN